MPTRFSSADPTSLRQPSDHEGGLLKFRRLPCSVILVPITAISGSEKHAELICVSCMGADWCHVANTSGTNYIQECFVCDIQGVTSSTHECYIFLTAVSHYTKERHVSQDNPGHVSQDDPGHVSQDDPGHVQPPRSHISIS